MITYYQPNFKKFLTIFSLYSYYLFIHNYIFSINVNYANSAPQSFDIIAQYKLGSFIYICVKNSYTQKWIIFITLHFL